MNKITKAIFCMFVSLIVLPLATATCFTYGDHYCQDISQEQAAQYCQKDCNIKTAYSEQPCSELPQCTKVFCKDGCKKVFLKDCRAGEVPAGQEKEWCTAGCCVYQQGQPSCQYKNTKAQCSQEAEKKGVSFYFDPKITDCSCSAQVLQKAGIEIPQPPLSEDKKMFYFILGFMAFLIATVVYLRRKRG